MQKQKLISLNNFPIRFTVVDVVCFLFFWDHFTQEWVRTILVIIYSLKFIVAVSQPFTSEIVDIFKEGNL